LEIEREQLKRVFKSSSVGVHYGDAFAYAAPISISTRDIRRGALGGMLEQEALSFQIGLRVVLRTLEAGALGAEAQALPSDQRELLVGFVAGATRVWQMTLALSLTRIMSVGMESIKLKRAEVCMVMVGAM
jgi:hypothetical protein